MQKFTVLFLLKVGTAGVGLFLQEQGDPIHDHNIKFRFFEISCFLAQYAAKCKGPVTVLITSKHCFEGHMHPSSRSKCTGIVRYYMTRFW